MLMLLQRQGSQVWQVFLVMEAAVLLPLVALAHFCLADREALMVQHLIMAVSAAVEMAATKAPKAVVAAAVAAAGVLAAAAVGLPIKAAAVVAADLIIMTA